MALVYSQSWTNPTSTANIYMDVYRNGATLTVNATVVCTLTYSSGYINYDGEINFNMWHGGASASANIKGYSDRWAKNTARTRTRTCSMSFVDTGNSFDIGFNITIPSNRPSGAAFRTGDQYQRLGAPGYAAPSAPTWININPNPCNINSAPTITWGGARAGSLGVLRYDVEVRSTRPNGSWTPWLTISAGQYGTSYNEIALNGMNVQGQKPFAGVKYQYRIQSSDYAYAASGFVNSPELVVTFNAPTAPTNYTLSSTSVKKDGSIKISWSGATGGSGSITSYDIGYRKYNHKTATWGEWFTTKVGVTNFTLDLSDPAILALFDTEPQNGDLIQFRISTNNNWGQQSPYLTTSSIKIRGNQMWIKVNGSWVEGDTYLKVNGSWVEATPYIKVNGSWYEST